MDKTPIPTWDFKFPGTRLKPWLREIRMWQYHTSIPKYKQGVTLYRSLEIGTVGRQLAEQVHEDHICSAEGFDIILEKIKDHFKAYVDAEPEVHAEVAIYQTTRKRQQTLVEYTSLILARVRDMEASLQEELPSRFKCFLIKRQAQLTYDQLKTLHFHAPSRTLGANDMVIMLVRLDQPDALVSTILAERESKGRSNDISRSYPVETSETGTEENPEDHSWPSGSWAEASDETEDWNPEDVDDDGLPLCNESGETLVPEPTEDYPSEIYSTDLSAWAQSYRDVRRSA